MRAPTGHVVRRRGSRGDVWYAKYRLPDGRQVKRRIGPAWTERGRPGAGYFTKRTAEHWLADVLDQARRGELPGMVRTGAVFEDAVAEFMRWLEFDRQRKPSTLRDYHSILRAHLLPAFGGRRLEDITTEQVERWSAELAASGRMNNRTRLKILTVLHGVMKRAKRVWKLPQNPVSDVEKPVQHRRTEIEVFSVEEVMALVTGRRERAGRRDLPHRRLHRPAPRRARRAALAQRRLPAPAHPRRRLLHRARADDAQVRQGPRRADGAARRRSPRAAGRERFRTPARTHSSSPAPGAAISTPPPSTAATRRR